MLILILVFIIFLFSQRRIKDKVSRIFIWSFFVLWLGQSILSRFGVYDLFIPQDTTYLLVAIHMVFFYLGFLLVIIPGSKTYGDSYFVFHQLDKRVNRITSNILYRVLLIITFLYIVSIFKQYWTAIMIAQSISDARADDALYELYGTTFYYLNMLLITPMHCITMFLFSYKTFEKRDWMWVLMGLFLLMNTSLKGGRSGFIDIFIYVIFMGIFLHYHLKKEGSFAKRYSGFIVTCLLGVLMYGIIGLVTAGREGNVSMDSSAFNESQETTNMHFVTYFVGPIVAFDQGVHNNVIERQGGYHFGALTFNSVEEVFFTILNRIGMSYKRPIAQYGDLIQENYISIGAMNWNALYTWCNFFYCDLGVLGLIVFPLIIGFIVRSVIVYFYKKTNVYSASLLLFAYISVVYSIIRFNVNTLSSFFLICFLLYMSHREQKIIRIYWCPIKNLTEPTEKGTNLSASPQRFVILRLLQQKISNLWAKVQISPDSRY